jgi:hypothetical protein
MYRLTMKIVENKNGASVYNSVKKTLLTDNPTIPPVPEMHY